MSKTIQWHENFPAPRSKPRTMTDEEVAVLVKDSGKTPGRDYIIVDVRRTDFDVLSFLTSLYGTGLQGPYGNKYTCPKFLSNAFDLGGGAGKSTPCNFLLQ